jgi:hypothetical protein
MAKIKYYLVIAAVAVVAVAVAKKTPLSSWL